MPLALGSGGGLGAASPSLRAKAEDREHANAGREDHDHLTEGVVAAKGGQDGGHHVGDANDLGRLLEVPGRHVLMDWRHRVADKGMLQAHHQQNNAQQAKCHNGKATHLESGLLVLGRECQCTHEQDS